MSQERFPAAKQCLWERGSLVLRGVIDPEIVHLYRDLVEETHAIFRTHSAENGYDLDQARSKRGGIEGWPHIAWVLKCGQVLPEWLNQCFPDRSLLHLVDDNLLLLFLVHIFGGPCRPAPVTNTRKVAPPRSDGGQKNDGPAEPPNWHVDADPHGSAVFRVNLWTPLEDCGVDRPGLQAAILCHDDAVALSGYDRETASFDPATNPRTNGDFPRRLRDAPIYAPIMRAGDIFMFTHWTIHAAYMTPDMEKSRTSVELRFQGESSAFP